MSALPGFPPFQTDQPTEHGFAEPNDLADGSELLAAADPAVLLAQFHARLRAGQFWFEALLEAIREWSLPRETVGGREFVYLLEGEAFDWLLLAERICNGTPPGLLPEDEVEALLVEEQPPVRLTQEQFAQRLGPAKYWAHLNFLYGVRVERALQLALERVIEKERGSLAFSHQRGDLDSDPFGRIYGAREIELLREYRAEQEAAGLAEGVGERFEAVRLEYRESQAFTYWLFRRRLQRQDPARVASDTRRGLQLLSQMEAAKRRRQQRRAVRPPRADAVIDAQPVHVG